LMSGESSWSDLLRWPHIARYVGAMFAFEAVAFLLGIGFFIIAVGIAFAFRRLALFWRPANRLMSAITGIPDLPVIHRAWSQWWLLPGDILRAAFALALLFIGARMLLLDGFCGQSLFC